MSCRPLLGFGAVAVVAALALPRDGHAESTEDLVRRLEMLELQLAAQSVLLEDYKARVEELEARFGPTIHLDDSVMALRAGSRGPVTAGRLEARARGSDAGTQGPVGEAPPDDRSVLEGVTALTEIGGVLTERGHLVFEPSAEFSHSSTNRFTFRGVELSEVVLIGVIEAQDADRDLLSFSGTFRYGLTDRLELEARLPAVYRSDSLTFFVPALGEGAMERSTSLTGIGFGDVELAAHYQINGGAGGWPIFVGNLRTSLPTGRGPFDVSRDEFGVETELPTGSGHFEIEPSLTAIFPSDPVVLFANVGYGFRLPYSADTMVGDFFVGDVDPGDAINVSFGMGFAVNDDLSFTLGYKHSFLFGTDTTIRDTTTGAQVTQTSPGLHLGSSIFGVSYRLSDSVRLNLDLDYGITEDAPDLRAALRFAIQLGQIM